MRRTIDGRPPSRETGRLCAYLAGAMERAPDRGRGWRENLRPLLEELGHDYFDPCIEELELLSNEERTSFRAWKGAGDERFVPMMRRVVEYDLGRLRESDYMICFWDEHAQRSGGSPSEVTMAYVWEKPVYVVRALPLDELSSWVQGCATRIFDSMEELFDFLREEYGG
ncbi:MAG: hypothetical protein ACRELU_14330 [Gemmatimonadota bacterium]